MKDYISKFGLEVNPFIKNSKEILVATSEYNEAIIRLNYLAKTRGFGLLTGSAGKGKTTAVRNWSSQLNTSLYRVIYSCLSTLTVQEFYRSLAQGLGVTPAFRKTDNFRIIQGEITRLSLEKKKTPVIIIDEANYVNNAILNDLKMLFNFEMDSREFESKSFISFGFIFFELGLIILHKAVAFNFYTYYNLLHARLVTMKGKCMTSDQRKKLALLMLNMFIAVGSFGIIIPIIPAYLKEIGQGGTAAGIFFSFGMDIWGAVSMYGVFSWEAYLLALSSAIPFTIIYAISNIIFLLLLKKPISEKLERIKHKYGILK